MDGRLDLIFNDELLITAGLSAGTGYVPIVHRLLAEAKKACIGVIQMYPATLPETDRTRIALTSTENQQAEQLTLSRYALRMEIPPCYEQQIFELAALCEYLLKSPFVKQATLRFYLPSVEQTDAIISATGLMRTPTQLALSWHSDVLIAKFGNPANHRRWIETIDGMLESSYEYRVPNNVGVRWLSDAAGTDVDVHFVPMNRPGCLYAYGTGKRPKFQELVERIGCAPEYALLKASNDRRLLF